jgi:hypothetical protein
LFFVCYMKHVVADDGWPSALQACKGNRSRWMLDKYKKGSSKEKKDMFVVFGWHL